VFIPILALIRIFLIKNDIKIKIISIFLYSVFSIPFIYLIIKWNGIVPPATILANPDAANSLGQFNLDFYNMGYATTIMGLYLFPLLFFLFNFSIIKFYNFLQSNFQNILFIFLIYIFFFIYFDWYHLAQSNLPISNISTGMLSNTYTYGLGFINKLSLILFDEVLYRKIFLISSFFASWIIIYAFFDRNIKNILIIIFFYFISLMLTPLMQEYFDPYIIIVALLCFKSNFKINFKNSICLVVYNSILLIFANIYYQL
jgi:hypothetical protein